VQWCLKLVDKIKTIKYYEIMKTNDDLYNNIQSLCEQLAENNHSELFEKGYKIINQFKENNGNKQIAYDTIYELHLKYMENSENKMDLVDDWLDCICGWVGRPDLKLWE
jgi:hypothetical protein